MALAEKAIHEAITTKHGEPVPPTYTKGKQPIDGIFSLMTLQIVQVGYTP